MYHQVITYSFIHPLWLLPTSTHPNYPKRFERLGSFGRSPLSLPLHKPMLPCVRHTARPLSQHHLLMHHGNGTHGKLGMNSPLSNPQSTSRFQPFKNPIKPWFINVKVLEFLLLCHEKSGHQTPDASLHLLAGLLRHGLTNVDPPVRNRGEGFSLWQTNIAGWNIPQFDSRSYIFNSIRVHFPASYVFVYRSVASQSWKSRT